MDTDLSSGAFLANIDTSPQGNTWRGIGSSWFNEGNVAKEDWLRNEQARNNQFWRDMAMTKYTQDFNAGEAQKSRDWQENMSNTAYQRAMSDMKAAGLNPILAYQNGAASTPSGASASSTGVSSSSGYRQNRSSDPLAQILLGVAQIIAGKIDGASKVGKIGFGD